MNTNIPSILYLSYRLAPFILVCFFSLSSVINQDFKGLVYLCGLLLISAFSIIFGNGIQPYNSWFIRTPNGQDPINENITKTCNLLNLAEGGYISFLPLNQIVFSYTFAYLGTIIYKYNLVYQNIPIFVIFPMIIVYDLWWNSANKCANIPLMLITMGVGLLGGMLWAIMIDSLKLTKLQYFSGLSNNEVCALPSNQSFRCTKKAL